MATQAQVRVRHRIKRGKVLCRWRVELTSKNLHVHITGRVSVQVLCINFIWHVLKCNHLVKSDVTKFLQTIKALTQM